MAVATILTYHRIVPDGGREFFHDIEETPFVWQLRRGAARRTATDGDAGSGPEFGPVFLTFDDGTADHRGVADLLSAHGLTGTFFVISGRLSSTGYLSEGDVRSIAAQGHRIASHSVTHRHLTSLGAAELTEELVASRERLEALVQRTIDWFAPPGGVYSRTILDRALRAGYQIVRTMDWGYAELPLRGRVPCLPVIARYDIAMFDRLLEGRAPLWLHSAKNLLKRSLGLGIYTRLRNLGDTVIPR